MNKAFIRGFITGDPELRTTQNGINVCTFNVAVNVGYGDEQKTTFFRVSAWRQLGENCSKYLGKGSQVLVVGEIGSHAYIDNSGEARSQIDITAREVEFLDRKKDSQQQQQHQQPDTPNLEDAFSDIDVDDIPF